MDTTGNTSLNGAPPRLPILRIRPLAAPPPSFRPQVRDDPMRLDLPDYGEIGPIGGRNTGRTRWRSARGHAGSVGRALRERAILASGRARPHNQDCDGSRHVKDKGHQGPAKCRARGIIFPSEVYEDKAGGHAGMAARATNNTCFQGQRQANLTTKS